MKSIRNRSNFVAFVFLASVVVTGSAMGQAVLAWGAVGTNNPGNWPEFGQCNIPASANSGVTAIACGDYHTIALKDGAVLAWGAGKTNT